MASAAAFGWRRFPFGKICTTSDFEIESVKKEGIWYSRRRGPSHRRFFEMIVEQCVRAGLVWGEELIFDATKARANASLDSLIPRLQLLTEEHLAQLEPAEPPATLWEQNNARWDLLAECRLDPERPASDGYERKSDRLVSTTDPDAAPMKTAGQKTALGFHDHYVIDGGKARIILNALVTPADVMENAPTLPLLRRAIFRWRVKPRQVIGDTTYGTANNIRKLEESGIRAYVPLPDWDRRTPYYGPSLFTYDAERDILSVPAGRDAAPPEGGPHRPQDRALSGGCGGVQRLPGEGRLHAGGARTRDRPLLRRGISRPGARLP